MDKEDLDQNTKYLNFDARHDLAVSGARIRRQGHDRSKIEDRKQGVVIGGWKDNAPKETHAVSNMTRVRKAKEKANAIDRVLFPPRNRPERRRPFW